MRPLAEIGLADLAARKLTLEGKIGLKKPVCLSLDATGAYVKPEAGVTSRKRSFDGRTGQRPITY